MRSKLFVPGVVLLMLGVAACGSSSTSSTVSKAPSSSAGRAGSPRLYHLALAGSAGAPGGAPTGRGAAVIAVHGSSKVCWRFAHLRGFTKATSAEIHAGATGESGKVVLPLSTGSRLHHKGCVGVTATLARAIEARPGNYYVSVDSVLYPRGAVRGQL